MHIITGMLPKILLADDNPHNGVLLQEAFLEAGIAVEFSFARNGMEALAMLGPEQAQPNLLILDLHMPRMSGDQVLAEVRSRPELQALPTVMLTSSSTASDRRRCCAANGYFIKCIRWECYVELAHSLASQMRKLCPPFNPPVRIAPA